MDAYKWTCTLGWLERGQDVEHEVEGGRDRPSNMALLTGVFLWWQSSRGVDNGTIGLRGLVGRELIATVDICQCMQHRLSVPEQFRHSQELLLTFLSSEDITSDG